MNGQYECVVHDCGPDTSPFNTEWLWKRRMRKYLEMVESPKIRGALVTLLHQCVP